MKLLEKPLKNISMVKRILNEISESLTIKKICKINFIIIKISGHQKTTLIKWSHEVRENTSNVSEQGLLYKIYNELFEMCN